VVADLAADVHLALKKKLPWRVLGQGSNVLLSRSYPGLTLIPELKFVHTVSGRNGRQLVYAGAGVDWSKLVAWCCRRGLHGLENLAMIPGSTGAAPVQNIGAYGLHLSERLIAVDVLRPGATRVERIDAERCQFGYRTSGFKTGVIDGIICAVLLRVGSDLPLRLEHTGLLRQVDKSMPEHAALKPTPGLLFHSVCALRTTRLPAIDTHPNVGSFFLNPLVSREHYRKLRTRYPDLPGYPEADGKRMKIPAGRLIEMRGWKGHRVGSFEVFSRHALVLVHHGGGDRDGILHLAQSIIKDIKQHFGIMLEIEPQML